jgi:predicted dehydrogenase
MNSPASSSAPAPFRIGLVGVGGIGQQHLRSIGELARQGEARLVAAADPGLVKGTLSPEQLAPLGDAARYGHYAEMLEKEPLDALVIAAPIALHMEIARAGIERGLYVYLEKPPVPLLQQLDQLIAFDTHCRVAVGFQMASAPALRRIKGWVLDGSLGTLQEIRIVGGWPRTEGYYSRAPWSGRMTLNGEPIFDGAAANGFAHLLHNVMFLADPAPDGFAQPVEVTGELYNARPMEAHDIASLRGRFASGVTFTLSVAHPLETTLSWRIEVIGTQGRAVLQEQGLANEAERVLTLGTHEEEFDGAYREFAAWVRGRRPTPVTSLRDTRGYLLAINGALLSSGGVRPVAPTFVQIYERNGVTGRNVPGLAAALERTAAEGLLLSEQGLPWARPGRPIDLRTLKEIDFAALCAPPAA